MSNLIQIKRGANAPSQTDLAPNELGYAVNENGLYIGMEGAKPKKINESAEKDSDNQIISETYVKDISITGQTLTLTRGDNKTKDVTIPGKNYEIATSERDGLMSKEDKGFLDRIQGDDTEGEGLLLVKQKLLYTHEGTSCESLSLTFDKLYPFLKIIFVTNGETQEICVGQTSEMYPTLIFTPLNGIDYFREVDHTYGYFSSVYISSGHSTDYSQTNNNILIPSKIYGISF